MNSPDPTRDALLVRAHAHAAECWKNHWSGGDPELFLQVAAPLTADSPEHEFIVAQTLALCCPVERVLLPWVGLFELACQSAHDGVRVNAAALHARNLQHHLGRMDEATALRVKAGIALLWQDASEAVLTNLRVRGVAKPA